MFSIEMEDFFKNVIIGIVKARDQLSTDDRDKRRESPICV